MPKDQQVCVLSLCLFVCSWSSNGDQWWFCKIKSGEKLCHVTGPGVAGKSRQASNRSQQNQAQWGWQTEEELGDCPKLCPVQQQACLHMQHEARLGQDMDILGDGVYGKSFGDRQ